MDPRIRSQSIEKYLLIQNTDNEDVNKKEVLGFTFGGADLIFAIFLFGNFFQIRHPSSPKNSGTPFHKHTFTPVLSDQMLYYRTLNSSFIFYI
jgi:hypothetical protein